MHKPKLSAAQIIEASRLVQDILIVGVGPTGRSSGELYSLVMHSIPLDLYERVIALLVEAKLVSKNMNYLTLTDEGQIKRRQIEARETGTKDVTP